MRVAPLYPKETHGSIQNLVGHLSARFCLLECLDQYGIDGADTQHVAIINNDLTTQGRTDSVLYPS